MRKLLLILLLLVSLQGFTQTVQDSVLVVQDTVFQPSYTIDALAPSKAAFYSAVIPGLGQVYNKHYWKVPIVYGSMALSLYYYSFNQTEYHRFRDAYKNKLAGRPITGKLAGITDNERLLSGQKFHQRNRDLSLLITVGIYILNIVDANVSAHLKQFNVNENLTLTPQLLQNDLNYKYNMGMGLSYRF